MEQGEIAKADVRGDDAGRRLERGDVVSLVSGNPPLTVVDIISDEVVECRWFWRGEFSDTRFYVEESQTCPKEPAAVASNNPSHGNGGGS